MRRRTRGALGVVAVGIVAALVQGGFGLSARSLVPDRVAVVPWPAAPDDPGGWSGLEVSEDGTTFWAISDGSSYAIGRLTREPGGRLVGAELVERGTLRMPDGTAIRKPWHDAEGLARSADGSFVVSFEGENRVWRYPTLSSAPHAVAPLPEFEDFDNAGLEGVALDATGVMIAFRERPWVLSRNTVPYLLGPQDTWSKGRALPRAGLWSVVGADFGPDGRLYLLERRFRGLGFATRIRSFDLQGDPEQTGRIEYDAPMGRHGNLEGIALWQDGAGQLRALLVSDDNRLSIQRAELVEVVLSPLAAEG